MGQHRQRVSNHKYTERGTIERRIGFISRSIRQQYAHNNNNNNNNNNNSSATNKQTKCNDSVWNPAQYTTLMVPSIITKQAWQVNGHDRARNSIKWLLYASNSFRMPWSYGKGNAAVLLCWPGSAQCLLSMILQLDCNTADGQTCSTKTDLVSVCSQTHKWAARLLLPCCFWPLSLSLSLSFSCCR